MKIIDKILKEQEDFILEFPYLSKYSWLYIYSGKKGDIASYFESMVFMPLVITWLGFNLMGIYLRPIHVIVVSLVVDTWYTVYWWKSALKKRERMESMRGKIDEYSEYPDPEVIRKLLDEFDNKVEEITDKEILHQKYLAQKERRECEMIAREYKGDIIPEFVTRF